MNCLAAAPLTGNNKVGPVGMQHLSEALKTNKSLTSLTVARTLGAAAAGRGVTRNSRSWVEAVQSGVGIGAGLCERSVRAISVHVCVCLYARTRVAYMCSAAGGQVGVGGGGGGETAHRRDCVRQGDGVSGVLVLGCEGVGADAEGNPCGRLSE